MDQERFDRFTKALATGRSRRSVLRVLSASIAAAVAGIGIGEAQANHGGSHKGGDGSPAQPGEPKPGRCGLPGQPCKFNKQCCPDSVCLGGYCQVVASPCESCLIVFQEVDYREGYTNLSVDFIATGFTPNSLLTTYLHV